MHLYADSMENSMTSLDIY